MRELLFRPRIDPDYVFAPCARLSDRSQFRRRDGRAPRNFVAKVDRLARPRKKRQGRENESLPDQRRAHYLLSLRRVCDARSSIEYLL